MIRVENLHKSFGDEEILKGITTTFEKGKTNLIIGQSGSGKTVFLKCLLGLFDAEKGEIYYGEKAINDMDDDEKKELREHMGMVFQGGALFDSMTVEENVMFPLRMFTKKKKDEMLHRVNEVLDRVNLVNANKKYLIIQFSFSFFIKKYSFFLKKTISIKSKKPPIFGGFFLKYFYLLGRNNRYTMNDRWISIIQYGCRFSTNII